MVSTNIAQGSSDWASASGTVSGGYKKYVIMCGSRGALYNTAVIDADVLEVQGIRVSSYWNTTNLGQITIAKSGNAFAYDAIAKTSSLAFD